MLLRLAAMYTSLARVIKKAKRAAHEPYTKDAITLHVTDDEKIKPFSFFRHVVINKNDLRDGGKEIITHEAAHARSLHSLDILLLEITIILHWFNPAAWLAKHCIKDIHEFEADWAVIKNGTETEKYRNLIIEKAVGARHYSIANSFNHSSTIKRITMMYKKKSNLWKCTKALYIVPVTAIATLLFSQPESIHASEQPSIGKVTTIATNKQEPQPAIAPVAAYEKKVKTVGEASTKAPNDTVPNKERVYQVVEQMPQFPGGQAAMMQFLQKSIRYPAEAREADAQGRSIVQFIVNSNGNINNAEIVKSSGNEALDKEALRVINSMPTWSPGTQGGKRVNTRLTLPIAFKINSPKKVSKALFLPQEEENKSAKETNSPLLIINGAVYEGNAGIINNIKEEDIESINVLQEEAATKLYGEKGKYGAIVLELKKHTQFDPKSFTYDDASSSKEPQIYQFNVGIKPENATQEKFDTPGAEFIGDTSDLQLGNRKTVLESGLTEGSVTIEFNVETDGTITFAKVTKSSGNNAVDSEALALIYNTQKKWKPATKDGKPVRSRPSLTLTFSKKG